MSREKKERYALLDTVRGACLISMTLYHGMYDAVHLMGIPVPWLHALPGHIWQQSICWTFILLSGMCWQLSKKHVLRGLILVGCSGVISLVTWLITPSELILYGVLTLLGLSALLLTLLHPLLEKLPPAGGLAGSAILFFLLRGSAMGYLGFEGIRLMELPSQLYCLKALAFLGFPSPDFASSDYFPLIPWFFLFLAGYFLWGLLRKSDRAKEALRPGIRPLAFLGRHSLLIYLLHQPVLMAVFFLLMPGAF